MAEKLWLIIENNEVEIEPRLKNLLDDSNSNLLEKTICFGIVKKPETNCFFEINCIINDTEINIISISTQLPPDEFLSERLVKECFEKLSKKIKTFSTKFTIPDDLFVDKNDWDLMNTSIDIGQYPLFIGPHGSGKTSISYALAKVRNWDFYRLNCGGLSKPKSTLIGGMQAKDGTTYFLESEFLKFYSSEKETLILVDELSRISSQAENFTMTMFENFDSYLYVDELGKRIYKGDKVKFVAAANFGFAYSSTKNLDEAFKDRFDPFIIDYLPENKEIECVIQKSFCTYNVAKQLVSIANLIRQNQETLRVGISTRKLISFGKYSYAGWDLKTIIDKLLVNLFLNGSFDHREDVRKIINTKI